MFISFLLSSRLLEIAQIVGNELNQKFEASTFFSVLQQVEIIIIIIIAMD